MECDGMRASTSRNQLNGSSLFSSQELTKVRRIAMVLPPRSLRLWKSLRAPIHDDDVVCFRKQAARCYESRVLTGDVSRKSFEQRDDFVSITNTQMSSG